MSDTRRFDWKEIAAIVAVSLTLLGVLINFVVQVRSLEEQVQSVGRDLVRLEKKVDNVLVVFESYGDQAATMQEAYTAARKLFAERLDGQEQRTQELEVRSATIREWQRIREGVE